MLIVVTYLLINRTKLGCAMRATFQDQDTASLMGVNVDLIYTSTFRNRFEPCRRSGRAARARSTSFSRRWAISPPSRRSRS
jgi:ABC-type xylose transport system permease subunit